MPKETAEFATITVTEPRVWSTWARGTLIFWCSAPFMASIPLIMAATLVTDAVLFATVAPSFPRYEGYIRAAIAPGYFLLAVGAYAAMCQLAYPFLNRHRPMNRKIRRIAPEALRQPLAFPGELTLSPRITTGWIAKLDDGDDIGVFVVSDEGLAFHGDRLTMRAPLGAISSVEVRSKGWKHLWAGRQLEVIIRTAEGDQPITARAFGKWSAASGNKAFQTFMEALVSYRGMARMVHG